MSTTLAESELVHTLHFQSEVQIAAPIEAAFQAVLDELGSDGRMPDGRPLSLKLEAWPGGRWYRDLGNNAGHLWAHVQVIKPPGLIELTGPMPMSYPAVNFLQFRLTSEGSITRLKFTYQAMGMIPPEHRDAMKQGWSTWLNSMREREEKQ